ncbi:Zn-dependent alcohol dehydrogenase [Novosphingobium sp. MMS21-SN21R]|uniref:Zn-dependent alcohol dehydrogenase n=1 Tax=Novosphingobium sp. MMS21-SN21R TaxID=2969298 RepID=UPI0028856B27|nr:Zn-dependent alcohol dehydrogenase [Novosphingobium sp. MMS21-SN21R]MDT0509858.1 Zn-dependent alcohol dehydrogenase [Novosphingobium sp. MMS21-SN21R]
MKAAVFRQMGQRMEIEDVSVSKPIGREVLVKLAAVGVCHSDLHILTGDLPHPLPAILGHEAAGIVEQVGPEVHNVKPGDHVVVCLTFHCGHCEQCGGGNSHRCTTSEAMRGADEPPRLFRDQERFAPFMNMGAFAEQILVHESGCVPMRRDMPFDRACLIGCGVTTGLGAAIRTAAIRPGETVAVIGCGGVGLSAINGAAMAGAGQIIAVDRIASKLELARTYGATDVVDGTQGNVVEHVMAMTGGRGVDHVLECIGLKQTIEEGFTMLTKGGTETIVGAARFDLKVELPALAFLREKKVQGSMMGGVRNTIDIPRYIDLYMDGRLKLDEMISRRRPLSEINEAFDDMHTGTLARSVITF